MVQLPYKEHGAGDGRHVLGAVVQLQCFGFVGAYFLGGGFKGGMSACELFFWIHKYSQIKECLHSVQERRVMMLKWPHCMYMCERG